MTCMYRGFRIFIWYNSTQELPRFRIIEEFGPKIAVDRLSLSMLKGSTIDYVQEMVFTGFRVTSNPNVKASCGCKVSFDVD